MERHEKVKPKNKILLTGRLLSFLSLFDASTSVSLPHLLLLMLNLNILPAGK